MPAVTSLVPVYCTSTPVAVMVERLAIWASKAPFFISNAVWPSADRNPKSAPVSFAYRESLAFSSAPTLLPTAIRLVPLFLKPKSPVKVTKLETLALKPVTPKASVFAAIVSVNV